MGERIRQSAKQREFVKAVGTGNEIITSGFPFAITIPRGQPPTPENTKFIFIRRPIKGRDTNPDRGLRKRQLKVIAILEALGLGKMVVRL